MGLGQADPITFAPVLTPALNRRVLELGLAALHCASQEDAAPPRRYGVIDYPLPSTAERLWVFDLATRR